MTREQFVLGYMLLTTQPWGKAYRAGQQTLGEEPSAADIQVEFYYQALGNYDAVAWQKACQIHATGDHWPSIDALKLTLKQQIVKPVALPAPSHWIDKDEFGVDLFEAIKCQAGMRQAEKTAEIYRKKGLPRQEQEYRERAQALAAQLKEIFAKGTIDGPDLKRLLAIT